MVLRRVPVGVVLSILLAANVRAQIPGSLRTVNDSAAKQDVFDQREDVFLAVGSAATPCRSVDFPTDGAYYFQVTSATGSKLLSTDPVAERKVTVKNGVLFSYDGTTHTADGRTACNSLSVRLAPFDDAGSLKAAYLVWLTPVASFEGKATDVGPVCGAGCFFGFRPEHSLTHAFRVEDKRNCEPTYCVSGTVFLDGNGDGLRQTSEAGIADVPIRVTGPLGEVLSTYSAPDGTYQVCGLASSDTFVVREAAPNGFKQTGPKDKRISKTFIAKSLSYTLVVCCQSFTGADFGNQLIPGAIGGTVFEDLNANGARDPGEPPLAGAMLTLIPPSPGDPLPATSAADGTFLFTQLGAGVYRVIQTPPTGYTQTQPPTDGYTVTLASGGSSLNNDFGDFHGFLTGTLAGFVFNDLNGNGVRDPGEPGMAGVLVARTPPFYFNCLLPPNECGEVMTGPDGSFHYDGVPFGTYSLSENAPQGYRQTAPPPPGTLTATLDFAHPNLTNLLFGNQSLAVRVFGTVFVDTNGNGSRDSGEPPQSGVVVRIQSAQGQTTTVTTGADGTFSFDGLAAGTYTLSELVPAGYVQTAPPAPGTFTVTGVNGDNKGPYLFGNFLAPATGSISGDKWLDLDMDGVVDGLDYPLPGIVFVLTDSGGQQRTTTSGTDGTFKFTLLPPGTYDLKEILPPNFFQTFPGTKDNPLGYTITLAPGENKTGYRFLNKC